MFGQVLCGWIINQKMRFFPPIEGIDTAAPSLYSLGKLHLIDERLQQRIGLDLDIIREGGRDHGCERGNCESRHWAFGSVGIGTDYPMGRGESQAPYRLHRLGSTRSH